PVKLRTIVQALDDKTHTQEVRLSFESAKPLPGTFGILTWQDSKPYLPAEFISQRNNSLGLFVNKNNKAHFMPIPNALEGQPIPLTSVIKENIIIEGRHSLEDGVALLLTNNKG
ncbi:MAG TPA: efflux RND transporter periplasmic adaptor subunit, partial [Gammaproteobacteria bacterium]|nr:efflux RND transporter periplasmic adaptor subunit [Gammaproteobacteria bacterium]